MKKIIDGRKYDTETATEVHEWSDKAPSDFSYIEETLFRKRTGEYFLYGYGGPMTRYAEREKYGSGYCYGSTIIPMTYEEARTWAEGHMSADEYEAEFGEVPESDGEDVVLSVRVSPATRERLRRMAAESGRSQGSILDEILARADS